MDKSRWSEDLIIAWGFGKLLIWCAGIAAAGVVAYHAIDALAVCPIGR